MADRLNNWRARLTAYLGEWDATPFSYGSADCWIFAMGAVEAVTGIDHAGAVRGYADRDAGLALIREVTGRRSHVDFVYRTFGKLPSVWHAMPGDLATIETHDGIGLGVVQGDAIYCLTEAGGLHLVGLDQARGAYAIGDKGRT